MSEHRPRSRAAAEATRGRVLRLPDARVALAVFHAACGGATEDPALVFGGGRQRARRPHATGAVSIVDSGVLRRGPGRPCSARRTSSACSRARSAWRMESGWHLADVELVRGPGGRIVAVQHRARDAFGSGDALARALDRPKGWGHVWSARFQVHREGAVVALEGTRLRPWRRPVPDRRRGAGAAGRREEAILAAYFPDARIAPLAH